MDHVRESLREVARDTGVSFVRLEQLYSEISDEIASDDVKDHHEFSLTAAVNRAIGVENYKLAQACARLYLSNGEDAAFKIKELIIATPVFRHEEMCEDIQTQVRQLCLNAHLPELFIEIDEEYLISHPDISYEDSQIFQQLFRDRISVLDALDYARKNILRAQAKIKISMLMKTRDGWCEENFDIDFPSLKNPIERSGYDSGRDKSLDQQETVLHWNDLLDPL